MATVAQVAKASLQRILVQEVEASLEPSEYQDWIFACNNYMAALDADGVALGYTEVSDLGDDITVPTGALRGIIANVAIEVAPDYNGVVSPALISAASEGERVMRKLALTLRQTAYPSTLPRGSGNYQRFDEFDLYYPELEAEILAESTGAILLEEDT